MMKYDNTEPVVHFGYELNIGKYKKLSRENYAIIDKRSSFYYKINPSAKEQNARAIEEGRVSIYDLDNDPKGLTYTDEYCEQHQKKALYNYDLNMKYYESISANFDKDLDEFLKTDGSQLKEYFSLEHEDMKKQGLYMLVLGEYKRIYIGVTQSQTFKKRILQHWKRKKSFDRLIFGSVEGSIISIDSFGCLDTTRIFLLPLEKNDTNELEGMEAKLVSTKLIRKYLQNRTSGGLKSFAEACANFRSINDRI